MINIFPEESTPNLYCLISDHQYDHEKTIRKATKEELLKLHKQIGKLLGIKTFEDFKKETNADRDKYLLTPKSNRLTKRNTKVPSRRQGV